MLLCDLQDDDFQQTADLSREICSDIEESRGDAPHWGLKFVRFLGFWIATQRNETFWFLITTLCTLGDVLSNVPILGLRGEVPKITRFVRWSRLKRAIWGFQKLSLCEIRQGFPANTRSSSRNPFIRVVIATEFYNFRDDDFQQTPDHHREIHSSV